MGKKLASGLREIAYCLGCRRRLHSRDAQAGNPRCPSCAAFWTSGAGRMALDKMYRALPKKWDAKTLDDIAAKTNAAMFEAELNDARLVKQRLTRAGVPLEQLDAAAELTARAHGGRSPLDDPRNWDNKPHRSYARRTASKTDQHGGARGGHLPPVDPTAPTWSQEPLRLTVQTTTVGPVPPVTWAPVRKASPEKERVGRLKAARDAKRALADLKDDGIGNTDRQREAHILVRIQGLKPAEAGRRMTPPAHRQTVADLLKKFDKATERAAKSLT